MADESPAGPEQHRPDDQPDHRAGAAVEGGEHELFGNLCRELEDWINFIFEDGGNGSLAGATGTRLGG